MLKLFYENEKDIAHRSFNGMTIFGEFDEKIPH